MENTSRNNKDAGYMMAGLVNLQLNQPQLIEQGVDDENDAHVTVSDPTQYTEGIKGKYTSYRVAYDPPLPPSVEHALFPHATSANRRYSDFAWLHERLHKERPGAIVPPLPDKQRGTSLFDEKFIEDRRNRLEIFLRRCVRNPELRDAECLLVFLSGGDAEFKRALRDGGSSFSGSAGGSNIDAAVSSIEDNTNGDINDNMDMNHQFGSGGYGGVVGSSLPQSTISSPSGSIDMTMETLTTKKAGIKKWIKEKKTAIQGSTIRSPDDSVFEKANNYISSLELGLQRIEAQATRIVRGEKDLSACMLEFGLGCDALSHADDEIDGVTSEASAGSSSCSSSIGQTFCHIGKSADRASSLSSAYHELLMNHFLEPLRDHLKVIQAVKVALSKRNNRLVTYSTCLNAVDAKRATLHKYRIAIDKSNIVGAEASLGRAEQSVLVARQNYEEVSVRVLREIDRFRREYAVEMYATMTEFVRVQKEYYAGMNEVWGSLLPQVEGHGASSATNGYLFFREANQIVPMPTYPPPIEPSSNGSSSTNIHAGVVDSSLSNGVVRYRELPDLHEE